jgi:hypothetical protein
MEDWEKMHGNSKRIQVDKLPQGDYFIQLTARDNQVVQTMLIAR